MATFSRSAGVWIFLVAATTVAPARAEAATVRVISCGVESCLLVRGRRTTLKASIWINERQVDAEGGRSWRVRLPVRTVENWSGPFARTLRLSVADPAGSAERRETVRLPIGLLGHDLDLASIVVRAR